MFFNIFLVLSFIPVVTRLFSHTQSNPLIDKKQHICMANYIALCMIGKRAKTNRIK